MEKNLDYQQARQDACIIHVQYSHQRHHTTVRKQLCASFEESGLNFYLCRSCASMHTFLQVVSFFFLVILLAVLCLLSDILGLICFGIFVTTIAFILILCVTSLSCTLLLLADCLRFLSTHHAPHSLAAVVANSSVQILQHHIISSYLFDTHRKVNREACCLLKALSLFYLSDPYSNSHCPFWYP